jgi:PTH2 family peptidyl-tRNA hydrolase
MINEYGSHRKSQELASGSAMVASRVKQVIVVRKDIEMGKGKLAVQVSHASLGAAEETRKRYAEWWRQWLDDGQPKIVVKVNSEAELLELERGASMRGLPTALIRDSGRTQLEPGTLTCLGIGPAPADNVDEFTGHLKLL